MGSDRLLEIYMQDQLAFGVAWRELAGRAARRNQGTSLGEALAEVWRGIAEEIVLFERMMRELGFAPSRTKHVAAIVGERAARAKLNGQLLGYSPLSRFLELDALMFGLGGKITIWTTLRDGAGLAQRLPHVDFDRLLERAHAQRARIEPFHRRAAEEALGSRQAVTSIPEAVAAAPASDPTRLPDDADAAGALVDAARVIDEARELE